MLRISKLVFVLLMLNACHMGNDNLESKVLAEVNGDEITVDQLQIEMLKVSPNLEGAEAAKKMLASLVDRQLLVQEALKFNLERAPEVIRAIESSKAQIYAEAYLAKKLAKLEAVSDDEVEEFVANHPGMFKQRKLFKTVDIAFVNDDLRLDVKLMERNIRTLESLETELRIKNIVYDKSNSQFLTDRLPLDILPKVSQLKQGDLLFVHNDHNVVVKSIDTILDMPSSNTMSISVARKLLSQQKKQAFINKEINRLQKLSTIKVFNDKVDMQFH
ncbi:EpsD family peptidyl-prolyl cis-trans isomerase [Methylophilus sp.]|jgi:EpsD family peptidyl-prolyl cis-trans isomerase|uniref:EpsD family peptidyl-prolyl cis-trans isomerase n=1 Tax=Methylophilus sp. TaxID=29541 RepID=UPI0011D87B55|nr:EpsD family peptidyl-prolyl cis-trans isomerase [Methylophilus sp.]TXI45814.1 MAG: peptidyl-prolyl cis-trans isomerase, EpsD family [Methylophilus sp.]